MHGVGIEQLNVYKQNIDSLTTTSLLKLKGPWSVEMTSEQNVVLPVKKKNFDKKQVSRPYGWWNQQKVQITSDGPFKVNFFEKNREKKVTLYCLLASTL